MADNPLRSGTVEDRRHVGGARQATCNTICAASPASPFLVAPREPRAGVKALLTTLDHLKTRPRSASAASSGTTTTTTTSSKSRSSPSSDAQDRRRRECPRVRRRPATASGTGTERASGCTPTSTTATTTATSTASLTSSARSCERAPSCKNLTIGCLGASTSRVNQNHRAHDAISPPPPHCPPSSTTLTMFSPQLPHPSPSPSSPAAAASSSCTDTSPAQSRRPSHTTTPTHSPIIPRPEGGEWGRRLPALLPRSASIGFEMHRSGKHRSGLARIDALASSSRTFNFPGAQIPHTSIAIMPSHAESVGDLPNASGGSGPVDSNPLREPPLSAGAALKTRHRSGVSSGGGLSVQPPMPTVPITSIAPPTPSTAMTFSPASSHCSSPFGSGDRRTFISGHLEPVLGDWGDRLTHSHEQNQLQAGMYWDDDDDDGLERNVSRRGSNATGIGGEGSGRNSRLSDRDDSQPHPGQRSITPSESGDHGGSDHGQKVNRYADEDEDAEGVDEEQADEDDVDEDKLSWDSETFSMYRLRHRQYDAPESYGPAKSASHGGTPKRVRRTTIACTSIASVSRPSLDPSVESASTTRSSSPTSSPQDLVGPTSPKRLNKNIASNDSFPQELRSSPGKGSANVMTGWAEDPSQASTTTIVQPITSTSTEHVVLAGTEEEVRHQWLGTFYVYLQDPSSLKDLNGITNISSSSLSATTLGKNLWSKTPLIREVPAMKKKIAKRDSSQLLTCVPGERVRVDSRPSPSMLGIAGSILGGVGSSSVGISEGNESTMMDDVIPILSPHHTKTKLGLKEKGSKVSMGVFGSGSNSNSNRHGGRWRKVNGTIDQDGYFTLYTEGSVIVHRMYLPSMKRTDFQSVDHSLFGKANCAGIYRSSDSRRTASSGTQIPTPLTSTPILAVGGLGNRNFASSSTTSLPLELSSMSSYEPVYLCMPSTSLLQSWMVICKCFAKPDDVRVLHVKKASIPTFSSVLAPPPTPPSHPNPPDATSSNATLPLPPQTSSQGTHERIRIWRSIELTILEGRGLGHERPGVNVLTSTGIANGRATSNSSTTRELRRNSNSSAHPIVAVGSALPNSTGVVGAGFRKINTSGSFNSTKSESTDSLPVVGTGLVQSPISTNVSFSTASIPVTNNNGDVTMSPNSTTMSVLSPGSFSSGGTPSLGTMVKPEKEKYGNLGGVSGGGSGNSASTSSDKAKSYFCEVLFEDDVVARTGDRPGPGPFWTELFMFKDLPPFQDPIMINVYQKHRSGRTSLVGTTVLDVRSAPRNKQHQMWLPLHLKPGAQFGSTYGEVHVHFEVFEQVVLAGQEYRAALNMLNDDDDIDLPYSIVHDLVGEMDRVVELLLRIYEDQGRLLLRLTQMASVEVDGDELSSQILFRGNTVMTKMLDVYTRLIGQSFLDRSVGEIIRRICSAKVDVEIDPVRLKSPSRDKVIQENAKELAHWADQIWQSIYDNRSRCPAPLRHIFNRIQILVTDSYDDPDMRTTAISAFIFLRYFVPAILNPRLFSLCAQQPTPAAQRTLTLIAKTLQGMANLNKFGAKEPWMAVMNPFVEAHTESFRDYIAFISQPAEGNKVEWTSREYDGYGLPYALRASLPRVAREGVPTLPHLLDVHRDMACLFALIARAQSSDSMFGRSGTGSGSTSKADRASKVDQFAKLAIALDGKSTRRLQKMGTDGPLCDVSVVNQQKMFLKSPPRTAPVLGSLVNERVEQTLASASEILANASVPQQETTRQPTSPRSRRSYTVSTQLRPSFALRKSMSSERMGSTHPFLQASSFTSVTTPMPVTSGDISPTSSPTASLKLSRKPNESNYASLQGGGIDGEVNKQILVTQETAVTESLSNQFSRREVGLNVIPSFGGSSHVLRSDDGKYRPDLGSRTRSHQSYQFGTSGNRGRGGHNSAEQLMSHPYSALHSGWFNSGGGGGGFASSIVSSRVESLGFAGGRRPSAPTLSISTLGSSNQSGLIGRSNVASGSGRLMSPDSLKESNADGSKGFMRMVMLRKNPKATRT